MSLDFGLNTSDSRAQSVDNVLTSTYAIMLDTVLSCYLCGRELGK